MSDAALLPTSSPAPSGSPRPVSLGIRRGPDTAADHVKLLAIQRAIELEVIPRLVLEHGARRAPPCPPPAADPAEAVALADALLGPDPVQAMDRYAQQVARPGAESAGLALLTSAARHLGTLWEEDRASFAAVTLATTYLHRLLHALSDANARPRPGTHRATALLIQVPGEQHTLGLSMLAHGFRQDGWNVLTPKVDNAAALERLVAGTPLDMVGFSMAADMHLSRLARCIEAARRSSANRALLVMVGGAAFLQRPELGGHVGACATARSAEEAVATALQLLQQRRDPPAAPLAGAPARPPAALRRRQPA